MRKEICICEEIRAFRATANNTTRVVILMHHRERRLTTNTARLAALSLNHCEIRVRGLPDTPTNIEGIVDDQRALLLLYPSENASILNADFLSKISKPITLIVPDGSWRQASKVSKRESFLKDIPHVTLATDRPSEYELRREPKENGLATFEAIARALGAIEGGDLRPRMERLFARMVSLTLQSRGTLPRDEAECGN